MTSSPVQARDQVLRLLALVPYLHVRQNVRLDEASRTFGVTPAQLLADLKVLFMVGLPGGLPDDLIDVDLDALEEPHGDGVIRVSNADYLDRPLRLNPTEASALIVALRSLRSESDPETGEVVDRALAKLEAAAAEGPQQLHATVSKPDRTATTRRLLSDALERGRQVRLTYYVPARDEEGERVVDPHELFRRRDADYLRAWCHEAGAVRVFRLDRIHRAVVLDTPVATRPEQVADADDGWFAQGGETTEVVLRLGPQARWVPEYFTVDTVQELEGGGLEVCLRVADLRWVHRLLLRLTPYAEVVRPPEVRDGYLALARETLSLYSPTA